MKKLNQKGVGAVEGLLILVIIGLVGFAGWWVYKSKNATNKTLSNASQGAGDAQSVIKKQATSTTTKTSPTTSASYLVIKEWGVKVKMENADKVTYTYTQSVGEESNGQHDSTVALEVKSQYREDKTCKLSVGYDRYISVIDAFKDSATKVGNYFYMTGGSPYKCDNAADDALNQSIRKDFANIEAE